MRSKKVKEEFHKYFKYVYIILDNMHKNQKNKVYLEKVLIFKNKLKLLQKWIKNNMIIFKKLKIRTWLQVYTYLYIDLMKRFLAKLKTPIIPYNIFEQLMNDQNSTKPDYIAEQMKILYMENPTKYLTLTALLDFMIRKVIPRAYKNKMNAHNMSVCFAPCLMWAEQRSFKDLAYMNKSVQVLNVMINNF